MFLKHFLPCFDIHLACRADKCKDALAQSQGMMLFGSKLKLAPVDVDGERRD